MRSRNAWTWICIAVVLGLATLARLLLWAPAQVQESYKVHKEVLTTCTSRRTELPGLLGSSPRIQYVHIAKTGGTSIQEGIMRWVKRKPTNLVRLEMFNGNQVAGSSFRCPPNALSASFLMGHRGMGFCDQVESSPKGLFTFAAFRNPISRMVSIYDYNLKTLKEPRAVRVFGKLNLPLRDVVKRFNQSSHVEFGERILRYSGSLQSRYMCGYQVSPPSCEHGRA